MLEERRDFVIMPIVALCTSYPTRGALAMFKYHPTVLQKRWKMRLLWESAVLKAANVQRGGTMAK